MSAEEIQLEVGDERFSGRLNVPDEESRQGVVVLPGAGHGPYGDIFDRFADEASGEGLHVLRFRSWENHEELNDKGLDDLHQEINAAVAFLQAHGCAKVSIIAKSFGGAITLTHIPDSVAKVVLWAPAILIGDESNVAELQSLNLAKTNLQIDPPSLRAIETPVRILHGDEDHFPVENSRKLVEEIRHADLIQIDGADHSFLGPDAGVDEDTVERTIEYLTTDG